ncbi:hypothetical protein PPACK8108_LOCUS16096 [Phakopsora pachyrhizi]|uniref:Uncharacterized protein n=1 Tax=Phakopsora pachyrhizi TaxID=170000 RepID=A0AAV0B7A5_PHAPC|nr:hypothetical protein PPACK8108_LOCUS16096 [Phakopsora pachyrhizi]
MKQLLEHCCGGRFGLRRRSCKEVFVGFCWVFEDEGVAKEEQKLGGGAHQGQSGGSKTTGAMDL